MLAAMADRRPPPELSEVEEAEDDGIGMLAADHPAMARIQDALKKQLSEAYESKAQLYSERAAELARVKQRCARRERAASEVLAPQDAIGTRISTFASTRVAQRPQRWLSPRGSLSACSSLQARGRWRAAVPGSAAVGEATDEP